MWIDGTTVLLTTLGLAACGVTPRGYRDLTAAYGQRADVLHSPDDGAGLFAGQSSLELEALITAVVARNPSVELARQGWRETLAQYPQATSFDDPMIGLTAAPLSFFDPEVKIGLGAQVSQPLPYPGKRRLRGEVALAEADAAREDLRAIKQRLALMAAHLYYDLYLVERALAINGEHTELLEAYSKAIDGYLATGKAWQDDALKIDIDLAELRKQGAVLESDRDVIAAQINSLLHREPRTAMRGPPSKLPLPAKLTASREKLAETALSQRSELSALSSRERGASAGVELAERDFYPDFRLTGTYNRMWPMVAHQFMLGVSINLPVTRDRRRAAVDAAAARRSRYRADRTRMTDEVLREVETAYRRVEEADETAALYRDRVVPAAQDRVEAIRIGLDAGRTSFVEVLRAERELRSVRLRYYAALADTYRRRAELDWSVGRSPGAQAAGVKAATGGVK